MRNRAAPETPGRAIPHLPLLLLLAAASLTALWTVDVLVNLGLPEMRVRGELLHGHSLDFAGLLFALLPLALGLTAASFAGSFLLQRAGFLARSRAGLAGSLLAAGATAAVVAVRMAWPLAGGDVRRGLLAGALAGLAVLAVLVVLPTLRSSARAEVAGVFRHGVLIPLGAAFATKGFCHDDVGLVSALFALAALALWGATARPRLRVMAAIPPLSALLLAGSVVIASRDYGRDALRLSPGAHDGRPHVVLIVLDTVRADRLRLYGYRYETMPALTRWSSDAVIFRRAVANGPWTSPSHASMFSGRTVSGHGVHYDPDAASDEPLYTPAFDDVEWLPQRLQSLGYRSVAVTANPLAVPDEVRGFQSVLMPQRAPWNGLTLGAVVDRVCPPTARISERLRWRLPAAPASDVVEIVERAVATTGAPLFLFVNLSDAHSPYVPPEWAMETMGFEDAHPFSRYYDHQTLTRLWPSLPGGSAAHLRDLYDAELRGMDAALQDLLAWIDHRLGRDSVVIVTSDHGEELAEEGRVGHEFGLAQDLLHVPLLVRAPGLVPGRRDEVVGLRMLYDFIVEAARGGKADLEPLLSDGGDVVSERYPSAHNTRSLGAAYARAWVAITESAHKGVGPSDDGWSFVRLDASFERESKTRGSLREAELRSRIDRYWRERRDRREDDGDLSDDEREQLRALGYLR